LEKIKHGFKTLAECGGIRGVDDTSSSSFDLLLRNELLTTSTEELIGQCTMSSIT
jgi:hypothetical protein